MSGSHMVWLTLGTSAVDHNHTQPLDWLPSHGPWEHLAPFLLIDYIEQANGNNDVRMKSLNMLQGSSGTTLIDVIIKSGYFWNSFITCTTKLVWLCLISPYRVFTLQSQSLIFMFFTQTKTFCVYVIRLHGTIFCCNYNFKSFGIQQQQLCTSTKLYLCRFFFGT